jgi:hypothetical protein
LRLSAQQFARFAAPERDLWIADTAQRLFAGFEGHYRGLGVTAEDLQPAVDAVVSWAEGFGITGQRDVAQLCCVMPSLGHAFWRDPRFAGFGEAALLDANVARSDAVLAVTDAAQAWLAALWQGDTISAYAERLATRLSYGSEPSPLSLGDVLPNHWSIYTSAYNDQLLAWLGHSLQPLRTPAQRFASVTCALVHGTGWQNDPQYRHLAGIILGTEAPAKLAERLRAFYGGLPQ